MLSSGSIPVAFQPQHLNGHIFMDGGTVWNVNIDSAVKRCHENGFENEDIIVDIAVCDKLHEPKNPVARGGWGNW